MIFSTMESIGKKLYAAWMRFAQLLGFVNTRILLTLAYLFIIGPAKLVAVIFRKDFLDRSIKKDGTSWKQKESLAHSLDECRHQF
ncbi:MAG TPA: hypothetical protein VNN76_07970 [Bacteroidota bacterium]|nr:hypothetical protein [Bacteroidota bacterium]